VNDSSKSLPEHVKRIGQGKRLDITGTGLDELQREMLNADGYELSETDWPQPQANED
jgi:hypothetical protein